MISPDILSRLNFVCPYFQKPFTSIEGVKIEQAADGAIQIMATLDIPVKFYNTQVAGLVQEAMKGASYALTIQSKIKAHQVLPSTERVPSIKNIIAVASGKGGVGKSTTAVNLALALSLQGAKVGILDADIYGPSVPRLLGVQQQAQVVNHKLVPLEAFGIYAISMGNLVDASVPAVWRGPMASGALMQLLQDTKWPELDYLVIDLPPGTGDVQLTLAQKVPVTGAVVVTTPQDVATQDAAKGLAMFNKVGIPVLGVIENMSHYVCPSCGHADDIFGCGGGQTLASRYDVPLVGQIPLLGQIRASSDAGTPPVMQEEQAVNIAHYYQVAALKLAILQSQTKKNLQFGMPKVVVTSN